MKNLGNSHRKVHWSNFVKPERAKMGPVWLEPGLTCDQAQQAKPTKAHNEFIMNMLRLTEKEVYGRWEKDRGHLFQSRRV